MNRLHTSMRTAAPEHTLKLAREWAERAGIRSVTEITQLDCLGVPIFVSERGAALSDGFTFGKGLVAIESEIMNGSTKWLKIGNGYVAADYVAST